MSKINTLNERLKEVVEKFNDLKNVGLNEDILVIYISHKTRLSKSDVWKVLECEKDFYKKLLREEMAEEL